MTKKEFKQFQHLPAERERYICKIERLERQAENIATVKDKVQASQKEYPYTLMHVTVDAPEPVRYSALQRDLIRAKRALDSVERRLDILNRMVSQIDDSRTRQIITVRYIDGKSLKDTAIQFGMTEQGVLKIINKTIKTFDEFNKV